MPSNFEDQLPLVTTVLLCLTVLLLVAMVLLLHQANGRLAALSTKLTKTTRAEKLVDSEELPQEAEVEPGTPFEEFLKEDPMRRTLTKKDQFKAYRIWRKEKGLNWDTIGKDRNERPESF